MSLSQARLKEVLLYDRDTGEFVWLKKTGRCAAGQRAGRLNDRGYEVIQVDGRAFRSHILAWMFVFGEWPDSDVDHCDHNRSNNRIVNLRLATRRENNGNSLPRSNKLYSKYKGVTYDKSRSAWVAQIRGDAGNLRLGRFKGEVAAARAYDIAAMQHFGEFACLNFPQME